jgi:cysteine desulfurase
MAYLDHAATSPMRPEALAAMLPYLTEEFGNPSGSHRVARAARAGLEDARHAIAEVLGCGAGDIVFTSGGTEADNLAVLGALGRGAADPIHAGSAVCSAIEHPAVLEPCRASGARITRVDGDGRVDLDDLEAALHPGVRFVSIMLANNEVGTIQPIPDVAELVRRRAPDAVLHTDAVHAAAGIEVASTAGLVDMMSISGHKVGGPKGIGVLVVRPGSRFDPPLLGGPQERARRPGTPDVAGAVGMAAALVAADRHRDAETARIEGLRDDLAAQVLAAVPDGELTVDPNAHLPGSGSTDLGKVPGTLHMLFAGVDRQELIFLLDDLGVCASAGSSCASGAVEASHVLQAMGRPDAETRGALRFSLGYSTTPADVEQAAWATAKAVDQLRG